MSNEEVPADPAPLPDVRGLDDASYAAAKRAAIASVSIAQRRREDAVALARIAAKHNPTKETE